MGEPVVLGFRVKGLVEAMKGNRGRGGQGEQSQ